MLYFPRVRKLREYALKHLTRRQRRVLSLSEINLRTDINKIARAMIQIASGSQALSSCSGSGHGHGHVNRSMLLADGQNDCGNIGQAMASLKSSGIIFRHETVGFGITPTSQAAQDLRQIATQTGVTYHHAVDANQLADVFMEFVDTFTLIDMLGMFGKGSQGAFGKPRRQAGTPSSSRQGPPNVGNNQRIKTARPV